MMRGDELPKGPTPGRRSKMRLNSNKITFGRVCLPIALLSYLLGAAIMVGAQNVDCNEYQNQVTLSADPAVSMSYVVNAANSDTNVELTPEEIAAGGTLSAEITYQGNGWIGFAYSTLGQMIGSQSVIGLPGEANDLRNPAKYDLNSYDAATGINRMNDELQTLINATITQENGVTTLTFTKLLSEFGEMQLVPNTMATFLWAVATSNDLVYHGFTNKGSFELFMEPCSSTAGITEDVAASTPAPNPPTMPPNPPPTPAPNTPVEGGGGNGSDVVDCNEYQSTITLSSNPAVTMSYVVNAADSNTNVELTPEQVAAGGVLSAQVVYQGSGWVGWAASTEGRMVGSEAIIGLPADNLGLTNPGKYDMTSTAPDGSGVTLMDTTAQTLTGTNLTQENSVTTLTFTKLLNEPGEIPIDPNGPNTFLWAVGGPGNNALGYHGFENRGSFRVVLEACNTSTAVADAVVELAPPSQDYRPYWKAHGTMAAIAWGFFAPVAVASSMLRSFLPEGPLWFRIHQCLNMATWVFSIVVFSLAVHVVRKSGGAHFDATHQRVGLAIFILVSLQCIGGLARPGLPKAAEGAGGNDGAAPKKSAVRFSWEILHRLSGLALLGMAFYNVITGLDIYGTLYSVDTYARAFWGWIVAFCGLVILLYVYSKLAKEKKQ